MDAENNTTGAELNLALQMSMQMRNVYVYLEKSAWQ